MIAKEPKDVRSGDLAVIFDTKRNVRLREEYCKATGVCLSSHRVKVLRTQGPVQGGV